MKRLSYKTSKVILFGCFLALMPFDLTWASQREVQVFQGVARNENGEIAYIEDHRLIYQGDRHLQNHTRYRDATGSEFAELTSGFTSHPYIPDYHFEDRRFGRKDGALVQGDVVKVFARKSATHPRQEAIVPLTDNMITGQGLHFFIQDHLSELANGVVKKVDFLVPLEKKSYPFKIYRIDKAATEPGTLWIRIEIDHWLFRLFAPDMEVQYALASKKLLSYRGASNLLNAQKDLQKVLITYRYDQ